MATGITRIAVEGFKSIATRQEIEIAPLTILAGANSSGKSSIMQPLLMLKQTLEATYDPGPLKIDGPNVNFNRRMSSCLRALSHSRASCEWKSKLRQLGSISRLLSVRSWRCKKRHIAFRERR
jgi:predicted ATPase